MPLIPLSDRQYIENYGEEGLAEPFAAFGLSWVHGGNAGEWGEETGDLERLIGHKPTTAAEYLRDNYPIVIPEIEYLKSLSAA